MDYIITTDYGCDLSKSALEKYGIEQMRMKYEINGTEYECGNLKKFYKEMRSGFVPKTAQVNIQDATSFFEHIAVLYEKPILHICMAAAISGTYENCVKAAKDVSERLDIPITVIDSCGASLCYGMLCVAAADNRNAGMSYTDNIDAINSMKEHINTYYTTNDLTYLKRSGRVSGASAVIGQILGINPILALDKKGKLFVCDKVRGEKNTLKKLIEYISKTVIHPEESTLYIGHTDCTDRANTLKNILCDRFGFKDCKIYEIGEIIGAHAGPGLVAAFYTGTNRA